MKRKNSRGFTLAELLIAAELIAIIILLAAPLFPKKSENQDNSISSRLSKTFMVIATAYVDKEVERQEAQDADGGTADETGGDTKENRPSESDEPGQSVNVVQHNVSAKFVFPTNTDQSPTGTADEAP